MNERLLETDYLVVGSGAVGMAFADTLLTETDASIVIVDRYAKPGGHWNVAYPFVTLHQPSAYYGVSSRELGTGRKDALGLNQGLYDLATGSQVSAYFDDVMRQRFLTSGRVQYFPMCDYQGDGLFVSRLTGQRYRVRVNARTVDATYLNTSVPATHTPNFSVAPRARFMPLNDLPQVSAPPAGYVVIGGGKTGIDACLWLLANRVEPDKIRWIVPRDAWLLDRENTQPGEEFFERSMGGLAAQFEAIAQAESIADLFDKLESAGVLVRIDTNVRPAMFHGATVSRLELAELRRIKNVVRLGRVWRLEADRIVLECGTLPTSSDQLHVDCSAVAIRDVAMKPIFAGDLITPQTVRAYQPVFSAAFIAHIEAAYEDDAVKNELCGVVPLPNHDTDWIRMLAAQMMNQYRWSQTQGISQWLIDNRLDGFSALTRNVDSDDAYKQAILKRMRDNAEPAVNKLQQFITELHADHNKGAQRG